MDEQKKTNWPKQRILLKREKGSCPKCSKKGYRPPHYTQRFGLPEIWACADCELVWQSSARNEHFSLLEGKFDDEELAKVS